MDAARPQERAIAPPGAPARSWLLRCVLAAGAPIAFALVLEGSLRLLRFGQSTELFVADDTPGFLRTNPGFTAPYFPKRFDIGPLAFRIARRKEPGHIRVFVLGESAVRGTPEPGFGFTALLRAQLQSAYPDKPIEVYNLGIVAISSHVVYQAARQLAALEPDLLVVYMGNNEVVGPYGPGSVTLSVSPPLPIIRASIWVAGTRTGQLVQKLAEWVTRRSRRPIEWMGMGTFVDRTVRGSDARLEDVYANFEANLRDIVRAASAAGAKTVVATVVANLRDCPPFVSEHRAGIKDAELARWDSLYGRAVASWEIDRPKEALPALREALQIDPEFAEAHFVLGRVLEATGDSAGARAEYIDALHWDALRFRPDPRINEAARRVAAEAGAGACLVDSALELGSDKASAAPPSGREILLEHVHFNWEGNVRMSRLLAGSCAEALFGPGKARGPWLDASGCAEAVGFTEFGLLRTLEGMEPIRGKPPFTNQISFGEDQIRYRREIDGAQARATSAEGLAAARQQIEAAARRRPDDPSLALRLSEVASEAGDPATSLSCLDKVLELEPPSSEVLVERARALASLRRQGEAQQSILDAIHIDPDNLPAYGALVEVARDSGDSGFADGVLATAIARNPASAYLLIARADLHFAQGERDRAEGECRQALALDPGNPDALRRLISFYDGEGHKDRSFALMQQARVTQPMNYENNLELAREYDARGDEDHAVECLRAATKSGPATAQAHIFIARHLAAAGRHLEELVELHRARRAALLAGEEDLARQVSDTIRAAAAGIDSGGADNRH